MSVDTIERINAYFEANITDVIPVYTIFKNVNEGLPESGSGPFIKLWVEPSDDFLLTDGGQYQEDGIVIAQVFVEEGESTLILHEIMDQIKLVFRQLQMSPTGTEIGLIAFEPMEFSNSGTVTTEDFSSSISWRKWDMFMPYSKYDCADVVPPVDIDRNFTTFSAAGSMYITIPDQGTATSSAKLVAKFATTTNDSTFDFIIGRHSVDRFYAAVRDGQLVIGHGSSFTDMLGVVDDGLLHEVIVEQIGAQITAQLDGVEVLDIASNFSLSMNVMAIARRSDTGVDFFSGVVADAEVYLDGVLLISYPVDEDWVSSTAVINIANPGVDDSTAINITSAESETFTQVASDWLGAELAAASTFNFTTTGIGEQVNQTGSGTLGAGQKYKVIADNATANTFNFVPFGGAYVSAIDAIAEALSTTVTWEGNQIGDYELSNITVKRILEVAP